LFCSNTHSSIFACGLTVKGTISVGHRNDCGGELYQAEGTLTGMLQPTLVVYGEKNASIFAEK